MALPAVSVLSGTMASLSLSSESESPSRTRLGLEHLPNELLIPIAQVLVPAPPQTTRFALRPTGTWEFRDAEHQWAHWLASHRNLLALAQTSRRMVAIAKPLLYHTIIIPNPKSLVVLYHRLYTRPEIRPWVRELSCLVSLAEENTILGTYREWANIRGDAWAIPPVSHDTSIASELLKRVLLHSVNLRDFLVAFPDHALTATSLTEPQEDEPDPPQSHHDQYQQTQDQQQQPQQPRRGAFVLPVSIPARRVLHRYIHPVGGQVAWRWFDISFFFPLDRLRNLTSLRIYCNREDGARDRSLSRILADYAVTILPQLRQLKTLELCCDQATVTSSVDSKTLSLPALPQLETIRFYGSSIREPNLVAFCLACTNLQTLVVHFEASSTDEDREDLPEGKTLSEALRERAATLRALELVAFSEGHYLTRGRERPRKPENHRLMCIPDLIHLESLTLDYRGVFGTLGILEEDDGERLCQLLPESLQDFTLVCEWGTENDWKQSYMANLDMVLHGVQCLCQSRTRSPNLATISLAIHSWPAEGKFHRRFRREVEAVRRRCAWAGIQFRTFDLLPSYRDEDEPEFQDGDEEAGPAGQDEGHSDEWESGEETGPGPSRAAAPATGGGSLLIPPDDYDYPELEEEDEASEYYNSGDEEPDPERAARRPPTFEAFVEELGEDHGHSLDELFFAYHEDRWDQYLF
ncbi:hypothetical protein QC761_404325 [Podospora bellae-mahoneyi]|uniref:F-box domain-containing protein n=1 Tax=Podospora bellae-mahoneyi TaxID=2093777 RepID=A0ABR0FIT3_9PEZI|nr:hypothetical protein QC761_404325 [Podospora bellae-mahoneyi]